MQFSTQSSAHPFVSGWLAAVTIIATLSGCAATPAGDPLQSLERTDLTPARQVAAMQVLDADPTFPPYLKALRRVIVQPGYSLELRNEAWDRIAKNDVAGLKSALELNLPRMLIYEWRREICKRVGGLGWKDLTPTLVRAWAVVIPAYGSDLFERPEYLALVALWGKERVPQVLYELLLKSDPIKEANLRSRCWELLLATGERARILALLADAESATTDSFILDMRRSASDLGIIARNREEILWMRALRTPAKRAFWDAARAAVERLSPEVRETLEPRDLAIVVASAAYQPELLTSTRDQLFERVSLALTADKKRRYGASFEGYGTQLPETPRAHAAQLKWGDCAAILIALSALEQPALCKHLFDVADRDQIDRLTEYGGLVRLDTQGRYELVEYAPQSRGSDVRFEASQEMFDAGYDALFHFHNHAQAFDNQRYAGPHFGDFGYADATMVNALVFTFIDHNTLNADYYRRGQVVIDLGTIKRPEQ
ncbi:MAG: hypothetical protein EXS17_04670 [Phycisphaerales bacterium]|nr:hypothetical protein [Phycisphaerales bacterium]